jgi:serine/alanine adding enzyme
MPLRIEPFEGTADEWDAMLRSFDGGSFCHRYGWRSVMEEALGHETHWMVARKANDAPEAILPLVRVRSRLFGDYLVSMPFLNYGGPVGSAEGRQALAEWAAEEAARLGVDLLELRNRHPQPPGPLHENVRKITVVKALPSDPEELWTKGIKAKVRSQVRRPMKEGMEVAFGPHLLDDFYRVFSTTMRDLGTPVLPKSFFQAIANAFSESSLFGIVTLQGEAVAAGCALSWSGELEISWAGSSREHSRLAPNMLLYWGMMEESVRRGMHTFNFGRCSPGSGTHRFKKQWGTEDEPLPWLQWTDSGVPSTPNPDSPKYRFATSVWSRLPVSVTNLIGPRLSRSIP